MNGSDWHKTHRKRNKAKYIFNPLPLVTLPTQDRKLVFKALSLQVIFLHNVLNKSLN